MAIALPTMFAGVADAMAEVERKFDQELRSDVAGVNTLVRHVARFRGKMLRPALLLLAGRACGEVTEAHTTLGTVVEMVHMATLVHDDVLDAAELRRRGATINHLRGNEAAVLLGDYLISHSYHLCSELNDPWVSRMIAATTNAVCEGELLQLENRGNLDLSEAVYLQIIERKTASLIATSAMLGARYAGATDAQQRAMHEFGRSIGIAFQVQDDVLDLVGDVSQVGKSLGSDVEQGKMTLPLIHFLRTAPAEHRHLLRSLLKGDEPDRVEKVRNLITPSGSIGFARQAAQGFVDRAIECLDAIPESPDRDALAAAARFVTERAM